MNIPHMMYNLFLFFVILHNIILIRIIYESYLCLFFLIYKWFVIFTNGIIYLIKECIKDVYAELSAHLEEYNNNYYNDIMKGIYEYHKESIKTYYNRQLYNNED